MTTKEYTYLLNKPQSLTERQTEALENILDDFPYLQSARAIYLKGLYNRDSFRYNNELKKTAAYTTERSQLFDFITSEQFRTIQKDFFEKAENAIANITVKDSEVVNDGAATEEKLADKQELSIKQSINSADETKSVTKKDETTHAYSDIGKPLPFDKAEKHSFAEWLQLSKLKPINRDNPPEQDAINPLDEKISLIDKFIDSNPKITPVKNQSNTQNSLLSEKSDNSSLMTETLAKVYLEQKKYTKAIQAYEILILKYPEKSVFFANRISEIKDIQQNNN